MIMNESKLYRREIHLKKIESFLISLSVILHLMTISSVNKLTKER
jgi:hypothetical protein